jgi:hypothetical protein
MKTLVIHPNDPSTDFLKEIYKGKDWTIMNHPNEPEKEIINAIKSHGRIIMMGHGCPDGLFGIHRMLIHSGLVYLLREKLCVCIWCNSDQFVLKYKLRGFYTGMFLSEVGEAEYYKIKTDQASVSYSNYYFANLMNGSIDSLNLYNEIKSAYTDEDNPVIQFNNKRLYERDEESLLAQRDIDDEIDPAGGHGLYSHI